MSKLSHKFIIFPLLLYDMCFNYDMCFKSVMILTFGDSCPAFILRVARMGLLMRLDVPNGLSNLLFVFTSHHNCLNVCLLFFVPFVSTINFMRFIV